jgi:hypothetical protein
MHICLRVCVFSFFGFYIHTHTYTCVCNFKPCIGYCKSCTSVVYVHTYIHIHTYTCIGNFKPCIGYCKSCISAVYWAPCWPGINMCVCVRTRACTCMCVTCVCTCMWSCTCTHTHTHIRYTEYNICVDAHIRRAYMHKHTSVISCINFSSAVIHVHKYCIGDFR